MEPFLVREQHVQTLHQFSRALASTFNAASPEIKKALGEALFAECVQCRMSVNGLDLMEVCAADPNAENNKLTRLRLGYCARKNCDTYSYRLKFLKHIDLNWDELLPQVDSHINEQVEEVDRSSGVVEAANRAEQFRVARKIGIAAVVILVLLIIRQFYLGGTIPVIREPEKFHVTPKPNVAEELGD